MSLIRQPKQLFLLASVEMWKSFSHYGNRSLLMLYMIKSLNFSDSYAYGVYAIYGGLVELGGVLGGLVADRLFGLKRTILLGAALIALGHLSFSFENSLFLALGLIVLGSNLFSTNIFSLLGLYYEKNDPRREEGFTLFYMGLNFGGFLAAILCGIIAEKFGWHWGFGLAAFGMLIANVILFTSWKSLKGKGDLPKPVTLKKGALFTSLLIGSLLLISGIIAYENIALPILPWIGVISALGLGIYLIRSKILSLSKLFSLAIHLMALTFFFAIQEQMASSLIVFSERVVNNSIFGISIPISSIISINPLVIILLGTFISRLFKSTSSVVPHRLIYPFLISGVAYGILGLSCFLNPAQGQFPLLGVIGVMALVSLSELMIGPAVYSFCSGLSSEKNQGRIMGLIPIGFALASMIGGALSKSMAIESTSSTFSTYGQGFTTIALMSLAASLCLWGLKWIFKKTIPQESTS